MDWERLTSDNTPIRDIPGERLADAAGGGPRTTDDLSELLADPSVWAEAPEDLEERVVEAISAEASNASNRRWQP